MKEIDAQIQKESSHTPIQPNVSYLFPNLPCTPLLTLVLQEFYTCAADEFPQIPELFKIGLYFEPQWKVLICTQCQMALAAGSAASHVKNHADGPVKTARLAAVCRELGVVSELPDINTPIPPISGLPIFPAALCCGVSGCYKRYITEKSLKRHYKEAHSGVPVPKSWRNGPAQRFDKSFHNSLFPVVLPLQTPTPPTSTWIEDLEAAITAAIAIDPLRVSDPRELNNWLRATTWPSHIAPYEARHLQKIVALPGPAEFPWLKGVVARKFAEDVKLIETTPLLALQKLNTDDPQKT